MNKYINAEKFKARVDKLHADSNKPLERNAYDLISMMLEDTMEDTPAADVKEVVRGKWIHIGENSTGNIFMCSTCDHCINPNKKDVKNGRADEKTSFCPKCGAKMGVE